MPGLVSVTVAPASSALTTLANVKDELQITDTNSDSYLTRQIGMASSAIARHCGRSLGSQTVAETFRFGWQPGIGPSAQQVAPYGTPLNVQMKPLLVSLPFVSSFVSVVENGGTPLVLNTDFETDTVAGLVYRLRGAIRSYWAVPTVVMTYVSGWQLPGDSPTSGVPALPAEVEGVCIALVRAAYNDRGRDMSVVMDWQEGLGRVQYAAAKSSGSMTIDDELADLLAPYVVRDF